MSRKLGNTGVTQKNNQQPRDKKKLIQDKKRNDKYLHQ